MSLYKWYIVLKQEQFKDKKTKSNFLKIEQLINFILMIPKGNKYEILPLK